MDVRDAALLNTFPVQAVPKYGEFMPLTSNGQRLLIAGNGFFLEVWRDWLYAIQPCAQRDGAIRYPFGAIESVLTLPIGAQIVPLIDAFVATARAHLPNECAAVGVYDRPTRRCKFKVCEAVNASPTQVTYVPPTLGPTDSIAVDIHSHGALPAFFSGQDDADDIAAVKIAICVGRIDQPVPVICARMCLNGLFVPLFLAQGAIWALDEHGSSGKLNP